MLSLCSSRQLKALKSWNSANNVNNTVSICSSVAPKKLRVYCKRNTTDIYKPVTPIRVSIDFDNIFSLRLTGRCFIRSSWMGSGPNVNAGGPIHDGVKEASIIALMIDFTSLLTGAEGFEPPSAVLETDILPLNYAPMTLFNIFHYNWNLHS